MPLVFSKLLEHDVWTGDIDVVAMWTVCGTAESGTREGTSSRRRGTAAVRGRLLEADERRPPVETCTSLTEIIGALLSLTLAVKIWVSVFLLLDHTF